MAPELEMGVPGAPLSVLLVDDDPLARRGIRRILPADGSVVVAGECGNAVEACRAAQRLAPDAVLLDIEMPDDDGFAVADVLRETGKPYVIFVTAYDRYAIDAFAHGARDYVLKPVAPQRLGEALMRARADRDARRALIGAVASPVASSEGRYLSELLVRVAAREVIVAVADLDWIEADSYYARLHVGGRTYLLREPLHQLERRLDPGQFVRVHRSAIVNVGRVREVRHERNGERIIVLSTGARVRASRARWRPFIRFLRDRTRVAPPVPPS